MSLKQAWAVLLCILLIYQTFINDIIAARTGGGSGGTGRQNVNKHDDSPTQPVPDILTYNGHELLQLSRRKYTLPTNFAVPEALKRRVRSVGEFE
ncbi:hypothetical protein E2C01_053543 [Portunus trituberculatus]|uniref:Uncharacterized protein n=1 Tax=Portunus trituberculatus TaxID=210409 RepID=A0A5B7GH19_PORTR|nr:hypothetical protein [Portunus trituberculatus]